MRKWIRGWNRREKDGTGHGWNPRGKDGTGHGWNLRGKDGTGEDGILVERGARY